MKQSQGTPAQTYWEEVRDQIRSLAGEGVAMAVITETNEEAQTYRERQKARRQTLEALIHQAIDDEGIESMVELLMSECEIRQSGQNSMQQDRWINLEALFERILREMERC